jgi:peptide/nickel transport system substrate-binding protein
MSEVAGDIFRKLGISMGYQTLDWATVAQRLNSPERLDKGGWSLNANYAPGFSPMTPRHTVSCGALADNRCLVGRACRRWRNCAAPGSTRPTQRNRSASAARFNFRRSATLPYVPLGAFFFAAYRKNLTGILKGGIPLFTNMRRA